LIRVSLGYPEPEVERLLFKGQETRALIEALQSVLNPEQLIEFQRQVERVLVSDTLLDYVQLLVNASRHNSHWVHGLSPRGGLALLKAARAWAFLSGRDFVLPEDVQAVWEPVAGHRLLSQSSGGRDNAPVIALLQETEIPR